MKGRKNKTMLYLFDLDGTLISGYMNNPDKDYNRWEVLPGRRERLSRLLARGNRIAIVTNQGGVAFGFVDEQTAWNKIYAAALACGLPPDTIRTYACFHHERGKAPWNDPVLAQRRKPSGDMIKEAMIGYPEAAALGVLMVGDREEDLQAAQAADVGFQWAHVFFGS
jgi:D-glycero-D-manno-heptose 1,7-bisphosphate phosphatase